MRSRMKIFKNVSQKHNFFYINGGHFEKKYYSLQIGLVRPTVMGRPRDPQVSPVRHSRARLKFHLFSFLPGSFSRDLFQSLFQVFFSRKIFLGEFFTENFFPVVPVQSSYNHFEQKKCPFSMSCFESSIYSVSSQSIFQSSFPEPLPSVFLLEIFSKNSFHFFFSQRVSSTSCLEFLYRNQWHMFIHLQQESWELKHKVLFTVQGLEN